MSILSFRTFNGLWDRGQDDSVPKDHFTDILNMTWDGDDVTTRAGSTSNYTISNVVRVHEYKIQGQASRLLILNTSGQIYDSTDLVSPILTISGMSDFSICVFFNRAYITPHNRVEGKSGEKVYVYNGSGTARAAAGSKPSGSLTVADGSSGTVEAGVRYFAVVYETNTGFLTVPGPATYGKLTAAGDKRVNLSGVPTGPSSISKRHIIATLSIAAGTTSDTGNQDGYSYYFVPGGNIDDNTTTTITVDFYDVELIDSADYLFNQLEEIPAGVNLIPYNGRLCVLGEDGQEDRLRVSKLNEPESFDKLSGFVDVAPEESDSLRNAFEFRGILYPCKSNRFYAVTDNGSAPGTWTWIGLDKGAGTGAFGVGTILDTRGTNLDHVVVATKQGLSLFDGAFSELELTHKVESYWKTINKSAFDQVQVVVDSVNKNIYAALPLGSATIPSHVLVGDYSRGMDPYKIRWSIYTFPSDMDPTSIFVMFDSNDEPVLHWGSTDGNIFKLNSSATDDDGTAIPTPYIRTHMIRRNDRGEVLHFENLVLRAQGSGSLDITPYSYNANALTALSSITLSATPDNSEIVPVGIDEEALSYKLEVNARGEKFTLVSFSANITRKWAAPPIT